MKQAIINIYRRLTGQTGGGIVYRIGGRVYVQRPLVLMQIEQLVEYINPDTFAGLQLTSVVGLVRLMGDKLAHILAIVLTPQGVAVQEKDLTEITGHLRANVDIEIASRVVADFLSCNPINSVFDRLSGVLGIARAITPAVATGLATSSASSPAAISPSAAGS